MQRCASTSTSTCDAVSVADFVLMLELSYVMVTFSKQEMLMYVEKWQQNEALTSAESIIFEAVQENMSNRSFMSELRVVILINGLYSAGVKDVVAMSRHIGNHGEIVDIISQGDAEAVERIAKYRTGIESKEVRNYSFATKYCYFHNPERFPIYDKCMDDQLWASKDRIGVFKRKELKRYEFFRQKVDDFIKVFSLEQSYTKVDHYLWLKKKEENGVGSIWFS